MDIESVKKIIADVLGEDAAEDLKQAIADRDIDLGVLMEGNDEQKSA